MSARAPISQQAASHLERHVTHAASPGMESSRGSTTAAGEVRISIERLGIEGLSLTARQGARVQSAVERELARLMRAQPLRLTGGAIAGLRAPSLSAGIGADADADTIGAEIACSLFAAMRDEASGHER